MRMVHGSGYGRGSRGLHIGLGDADIIWTSQVQHAVERTDGHGYLGRPSLVRMRTQLVADQLFLPAHRSFDLGAPNLSRRALPCPASELATSRIWRSHCVGTLSAVSPGTSAARSGTTTGPTA